MKEIHAFLGDFYHEPDYLLGALQKSVAVLGADLTLVNNELSEIGAVLDQNPAVILIARENRLNPEAETVENWLTPELDGELEAYVKSGGRLVAVHAGMASYPADSAYRNLLKGHFVHHPNDHVQVRYQSADFDYAVLDEHYFVAVDEADTDVFMRSHSEYGTQNAGWRHRVGDGKVICIVPTHNPEGFQHSETVRLLAETLKWALED